LAASTKRHTGKVLENAFRIYKMIGQEPSELVCVSALLHDTGRVTEEGNDANHHVYSVKLADGFLAGTTYSSEEVEAIKGLVYGHNDLNEKGRLKVKPDGPLPLIILCAADKLDRLGEEGAKRLYENRMRNMKESDSKKAKESSAITMEESARFLRYLNISAEYLEHVDKELKDGLDELEKL
jgi:HD superfamily phosphodiesterase